MRALRGGRRGRGARKRSDAQRRDPRAVDAVRVGVWLRLRPAPALQREHGDAQRRRAQQAEATARALDQASTTLAA